MRLEDLRSGDLLLLGGDAARFAVARRLAGTATLWIQTAIVLRLDGIDEPLFFGSTHEPLADDIVDHGLRSGVQTTVLRDQLRRFDGVVAARRPQPSNGALESRLRAFRLRVDGRPFKAAPFEMARGRQRRNTTWNDEALYCCELTAAAYQATGVLRPPPGGRLPNNYVPSDFCCAEECLDLVDGVDLGPEYELAD